MTSAPLPPSHRGPGSPEPDPLVGALVAGRYRVRERLGEGGMGLVYFAEHEAIEKPVALKVLKAEHSTRPDMVERFQREAISASRIAHPNLLEVFDFGKLDDGRFFFAMERLVGEDLADVLGREGALEPARAVAIALPICRALEAAHAKGVVHRDLKPENVFLHRAGDETVVKVLDFGVAKLHDPGGPSRRRLTKTGMVFGTWEYMSPEQASGAPTDARTDVYALGIIVYEMCAGRVPFAGDGLLEIANAHVKSPPPPLRAPSAEAPISAELETAILRALEKHPEMRYESMAAFAEALAATPEGRVEPSAPEFPLGQELGHAEAPCAESAVVPAALPTEPPPTRALALGAIATAAVIAIGSSAIHREPPHAPTAPSTLASGVEPPLPREVPPPPKEPPPLAALNPSALRLHVTTRPMGATILKNGATVCASSPCDVEAVPNETLVLTAEKQGLLGTATLVADHEREVEIPLAKTAAEAKSPLATRGAAEGAMRAAGGTAARARERAGECEWDLKKLRIVGPCSPKR